METRAIPTPEGLEMVAASDLVRRFGHWGERALSAPIYVLHRGRPRLMLASIDLIEMLCRSHRSGDPGDLRRAAALLEASPGPVVVVDAALDIVTLSRSARAYFGDRAAPGASVLDMVETDDSDLLDRTIGRVVATGLGESIAVAFTGDADRRTALTVEPHPDGAVLFVCATDRTADDRASLDETFAVSRGAAIARIDRFGFLDGPHTALAALSGIGATMLSSLRFVSLFSLPSRRDIADLIAAVGEDGVPRSGTARLLTDSGDPRHVTVAFAPRRRGLTIDGVVALILTIN